MYFLVQNRADEKKMLLMIVAPSGYVKNITFVLFLKQKKNSLYYITLKYVNNVSII